MFGWSGIVAVVCAVPVAVTVTRALMFSTVRLVQQHCKMYMTLLLRLVRLLDYGSDDDEEMMMTMVNLMVLVMAMMMTTD